MIHLTGRHAGALAASSLLLAAAIAPSPAAAYTHKDEVTTFSAAVAVSQVASDRCPDILADVNAPTSLRVVLHIGPADEMAMQIEIRGLMAAFRENADTYGKAWCDQQMERFGPEGTMMRGLLKRE